MRLVIDIFRYHYFQKSDFEDTKKGYVVTKTEYQIYFKKENMGNGKSEILNQLRSLLSYHEQSGIVNYPKVAKLNKFLGIELHKLSQVPEKHRQPSVLTEDIELTTEKNSASPYATMDEIAEEVRKCRGCHLCQERIVPVPGVGGDKARLLIVGGWLTASSSADIVESVVFGNDEDLMLLRMLDAIHLPRKSAFITNVIKCGITAAVQPKGEYMDACVSYLYRQIASISPDVICTMGIIATRAMLRTSKPLSQLRGRFHEYNFDQKKNIPLMPTYHPAFLLKNPEMKMATWNDLQLIEKKLTD